MKWLALAALAAAPVAAAELKSQTVDAFDRHIRQTEQRLDTRKNFLWSDESEERAARVRRGDLVVQPFGANPVSKVPGGLVHDWVGAVYLPGVTVARALALVQDYNRHKEYYKPEVVDSKILAHNGNNFKMYLRLLKR